MKIQKICRIVMSDTGDKETELWLNPPTGTLSVMTKFKSLIRSLYQGKHLYILSDEDIKDGDWFMSAYFSYPLHNTKELRDRESIIGWTTEELNREFRGHKIIATTDKSLGLPLIPVKFLPHFIEEYNLGRPVEKVVVDYLQYEIDMKPSNKEMCDLSLNPEDKTIFVKAFKEKWNRTEVETSHLEMSIAIAKHIIDGGSFSSFDTKKWLDENL